MKTAECDNLCVYTMSYLEQWLKTNKAMQWETLKNTMDK